MAFSRERVPSSAAATTNSDFRNQSDTGSLDAFADDAEASLNLAISAAYRQVFGNVQPMESERLLSAESRLRNGDINVREFVRALATSEFYRSRYFESVAPHRAIELYFKHLLGRPPVDEAEVSHHIALLATEGFDAEVA
ncbi:MAG: phycobilisome rod-core linker polypeptide, partial [Synechococcus sp.]